jgi:hypothetical protein
MLVVLLHVGSHQQLPCGCSGCHTAPAVLYFLSLTALFLAAPVAASGLKAALAAGAAAALAGFA